MDERRKCKNDRNEEGRTTEDWGTNWNDPQTRPGRNIKKKFQITGLYDLLYMKTKERSWNKTREIQNIGIEDSQGI